MTFTVGVWIEILLYISKNMVLCVTPLVGVWIEIGIKEGMQNLAQ